MKIHRFYLSQELPEFGEIAVRNEAVSNQLRNVLRKKSGDRIVLFNGDGKEYFSTIATLAKAEARFKVERVAENPVSTKRRLTLYQSMLKKDKLEWIIQKGTELGMQKFVPIISERSEKKGFHLERAQKIAIEAAEQSGRGVIPEITEPVSFDEAVNNIQGASIVFHGTGAPLRNELGQIRNDLSIFIGPEGGWTENELKTFKDKNISVASMSDATLRGETAALAALSLLLL